MEVIAQRLDHRRALGFAEEGKTCAEIVNAFAPPLIDREYVLCAINGVEIPREWWPHVTPKEGASVLVAIVPGKGGGKKNPLAMIASIAIAIVAPYAAVALGGAMGLTVGTVGALTFTGQVLAAGIGFVANMAIGAIFKPSQPSISAANASTGNAQSSPTYSLAGQSNVLDPFGPVRRIFGTHRVYPVVVGRPYSEVYGDDQYTTMLLDIGAGDYEVSDVRIGASHIGYFQNASYAVHRNTATPNLYWYWGARHDDQYNLFLQDGAWHQVDTVVDTGWFTLAFVFASGLAAVNETNGNVGPRLASFDIEYSHYGVGDWSPLENAAYFTASRSINPQAETVELSGGHYLRSEGIYGNPPRTHDDGLLRSTREVTTVNGYAPGENVMTMRSLGGVVIAGATFVLNGVTYQLHQNVNPTPGPVAFMPPLQSEVITQVVLSDSGDQYLALPQITAQPSASGHYAVTDQRIQQLALSITVRPENTATPGARWSIRVRQTGGQGDGRASYGDLALVGVASTSATEPALNLRSPHTLLELRIKANDQISGTLEEISCFAQSYLWVRRGGVWSYEISSNPAWALYEVLTGSQNKRPIPGAKLDLDSFEAWANYCDTIHPASGLPRARLDLVVDYYTTIFNLAQTITAAGRATLSPGDGRFSVLIDQPRTTPRQVFTPHNSASFKGSRTFIEAPHAFRAKFMNAATWKVEEFIIYNDGYNASNATVFEVIELPGVTREAQVWCDGRYRMAQGIHRQESWSLDVDWENLICTRGDLVHVAHDVPQLGGLPSRIKEVHYNGGGLADRWTLSEPVEFALGASAYGFTIRSLNGVVHQGQFGAQIDSYTVEPASPVAGITVGDLHVWGLMNRITYPFLVAAIVPQSDAAATLTLAPYAGDAIFGADLGTIPPYVPVVDDDLGFLAPPAIPKVTILQTLIYVDRRPVLSVSFDWRNYVAATFVAYEVWLTWDQNATGAPVLLGRTNSPSFEWLHLIDLVARHDLIGSHFCVQVIGVNGFGGKRTLAETPATCDAIIGDTAKPAAPPSFELDLKRDTITLAWEHPNEPDIDYYEIRYLPQINDAMYAQSTLLAPQVPYPSRSMDVPARLGTYFIKTVDTSGNRSDEYAAAFTPGDNVWNLNVVARWDDQAAGWPGAKSNFIVSGTALQTVRLGPDQFAQRAEYYYKDIYDGGAIYQTRFTSKINAGGISENSRMVRWTPLASATPIGGSVVLDTGELGTLSELVDVYHELRWLVAENTMSDWNPLASAVPIGASDSEFGAWRRFQVGDYIGQQFQMRLVAEYIGPDLVADVGAIIGGAIVEIDMTDRTDGRYDMACPAGGMRVLYAPPFKERPVVSITPDNAASGDRFTVTNSDRNGFDIQFFNSTGAGVARQFDWLAKGYGAKSAGVVDALMRKGTRKPTAFVTTRRAA